MAGGKKPEEYDKRTQRRGDGSDRRQTEKDRQRQRDYRDDSRTQDRTRDGYYRNRSDDERTYGSPADGDYGGRNYGDRRITGGDPTYPSGGGGSDSDPNYPAPPKDDPTNPPTYNPPEVYPPPTTYGPPSYGTPIPPERPYNPTVPYSPVLEFPNQRERQDLDNREEEAPEQALMPFGFWDKGWVNPVADAQQATQAVLGGSGDYGLSAVEEDLQNLR